METRDTCRLWLKLNIGKSLATEEHELKATVAGRGVIVRSERDAQPLSEAFWLLFDARGFDTADGAREFGEELRHAVHVVGLSTRLGVDARDPGEDRATSYFNPDALRALGVLKPDMRLTPDLHGITVFPDDGNTLIARGGRAEGRVRSSGEGFVQALEEALPTAHAVPVEEPTLRRAIRLLNLAEMNTDPLAKLVLAVSTIEGLATDLPWTESQREMVASATARLERDFGESEETKQVIEAIQGIRRGSIGQRIRKLLDSNDLSALWKDWGALYDKRSRLFHGGELKADRLPESELHDLGQAATTLCGRIVLSMAKRKGIVIPSAARLHFGVQ